MFVLMQKMTMLALTMFLLLMVTVIQPIRASHKLPDMEQGEIIIYMSVYL